MLSPPASGTELLIWLLGGVALLLWGMRMVRTGIQRAFGDGLRRFLERWLRNRFQAAFGGLGITLLLQSSMATCLLVGGLASRGLLATSVALAVMLGADVGTALVAQVLAYDLTLAVPVLLFAGTAIFLSSEGRRRRSIGRAILGLGMLLLALKIIVGAAVFLESASAAVTILTALSGEPLVAVLVAAGLAWLMHSSLGAILFVAALAGAAALEQRLMFAFVLGANIGGTIAPYVASLGGSVEMRRVALGNAGFKVIGAIVAFAMLPLIFDPIGAFADDPGQFVVHLHIVFNLGLAIFFLPFVGLVGRFLDRWVGNDAAFDAMAPMMLDNLSESDLDSPKLALANASREVLTMSTVLREMLELVEAGIAEAEIINRERMSALDDRLDETHEKVKHYLTKLRAVPLEEDESRRSSEILAYMANLEHAGDIIEKTLEGTLREVAKRRLRFSDEGRRELVDMTQSVLSNLGLAMNVFVTSDMYLARDLVAEKEAISAFERAAAANHYDRLHGGLTETVETSAYHLDVLRDLKRVNSHLCSAAYPILDQAGVLRRTRLKKKGQHHTGKEGGAATRIGAPVEAE